MTLHPIEAGNFKLDGGAMFGVVPKVLWNKTNPADSNNMIDIAARCLLIEDGNKLTLVDTGMGDKQTEKFFGYYHKWGDHSLEASLKKAGFHKDDVTDVFMTHLHFDHCGGSVQWNKNRTGFEPAFKNAHYWSNENHWSWATKPNRREKASFLKENILPMQQSGQLKFIDGPNSSFSKENNSIDYLKTSALDFGVFFADGHTEKQMLPTIVHQGKTIVFMGTYYLRPGTCPCRLLWGMTQGRCLLYQKKKSF